MQRSHWSLAGSCKQSTGCSSPSTTWNKIAPKPLSDASVCRTQGKEKSGKCNCPHTELPLDQIWCSLFSEISHYVGAIWIIYKISQPALKNCLTPFLVLGHGQAIIAAVLSIWWWTCTWPKCRPRFLNSTFPTAHFFAFDVTPTHLKEFRMVITITDYIV